MFENELSTRPERHPVVTIIFLLIAAALGFIGGSLIVFYSYLPFYNGDEQQLWNALQDVEKNPDLKILVYLIQAGATIMGLLIVPAYILATERKSLKGLFTSKSLDAMPLMLTLLIIVLFIPVISIVVEWNSQVHFPEGLKWFEEWAREKEDLAMKQTEVLTKFNSLTEFMLALVVVAVLPALGEEIVFRGIIQQNLYKATNNIHVSIWIAAILFSAIHLQFFGFVPRMVLGALFGYLYYWSGNLWIPVIAHFLNNGIQIIALYFYQQGAFEYDLENPESVPAHIVVICAVLTGGLLYYFYKYFENRKPQINRT